MGVRLLTAATICVIARDGSRRRGHRGSACAAARRPRCCSGIAAARGRWCRPAGNERVTPADPPLDDHQHADGRCSTRRVGSSSSRRCRRSSRAAARSDAPRAGLEPRSSNSPDLDIADFTARHALVDAAHATPTSGSPGKARCPAGRSSRSGSRPPRTAAGSSLLQTVIPGREPARMREAPRHRTERSCSRSWRSWC